MSCGCENEEVCECVVDVKMKRYVSCGCENEKVCGCVVDVKMKRYESVLWM